MISKISTGGSARYKPPKEDDIRLCKHRRYVSKGQAKKGFYQCSASEKNKNIHKSDCKECKDFQHYLFLNLKMEGFNGDSTPAKA